MALLTRERLEQRRQRAYQEVEVPDPDPAAAARGEKVTIRLRSMFGGEWIDLIRTSRDNDWRSTHYTELVLAFCLVDENGKRILQDDDLNTAWWKTQSKGFITAAIDAAMELSGLAMSESVGDSRKNSLPVGNSCNSIELPTDSAIEPPVVLSTTLD